MIRYIVKYFTVFKYYVLLTYVSIMKTLYYKNYFKNVFLFFLQDFENSQLRA